MALTVGTASLTELSEELAAAEVAVLMGTASVTEDSDKLVEVVVVAVMEGTASAITPAGSSSSSVLLLVALVAACFAVRDDPDN